jgi:hypothetical protein
MIHSDLEPALYAPIAEAFMCLEDDCDSIFFAGVLTCPRCASPQIASISRFLNRGKELPVWTRPRQAPSSMPASSSRSR